MRNCAARSAKEEQLARALHELDSMRRLRSELDLDDLIRARFDGLFGELDAQRQTLLAAFAHAAF